MRITKMEGKCKLLLLVTNDDFQPFSCVSSSKALNRASLSLAARKAPAAEVFDPTVALPRSWVWQH